MKILLLSIILLFTPPIFASNSYTDKKVIDGDTLEITDGNIYFRVGCKDYRESDKNTLKYEILPYVKLEKLAREKKLNIWSAKDYVSPCKYRKNKKSP